MSSIRFFKYQGAGNDFIIVNGFENKIQFTSQEIAFLCHRRFGIGADGLMIIEKDEMCDFKMIYYNSDGNESTMCGNGGRCIVLAAHDFGITSTKSNFMAIDGMHEGSILEKNIVQISMIDVNEIDEFNGYKVVNTGSPHIVIPVENLEEFDVYSHGKAMRNNAQFGEKGINVNFIEKKSDSIYIRTYERGVEDETWACGTGVTAAAISSVSLEKGTYSIPVIAKGGELKVNFSINELRQIKNVKLIGPAKFVFSGEISL